MGQQLNINEVKALTGLSSRKIYDLMGCGEFPLCAPLNRTAKPGWLRDVIVDWLTRRDSILLSQ